MRRLIIALVLAVCGAAQAQQTEKATFAMGCFWCAEEAFEKVPGVIQAVSGYTGGKVKNPSYEQVSSGRTGHAEAVQVTFDPSKVSYEKLLDTFWLNHDPTVTDRQFCDGGSQYRPEIFYQAEDYHQDYYKKNPVQYRFYVTGCGRYARLDQLWGPLRKH
jgi:peptide-methionine (S)-S-oxide reductase